MSSRSWWYLPISALLIGLGPLLRSTFTCQLNGPGMLHHSPLKLPKLTTSSDIASSSISVRAQWQAYSPILTRSHAFNTNLIAVPAPELPLPCNSLPRIGGTTVQQTSQLRRIAHTKRRPREPVGNGGSTMSLRKKWIDAQESGKTRREYWSEKEKKHRL